MVTEVYKADGVLDLFNRDTIDQLDFGLRTNVNTQQCGKAGFSDRSGEIARACDRSPSPAKPETRLPRDSETTKSLAGISGNGSRTLALRIPRAV
jgi:hypothetical protein